MRPSCSRCSTMSPASRRPLARRSRARAPGARLRGVRGGPLGSQGARALPRAFPDGQFTAQAKSRLAAVAVIEQRKREENERAQRLVEQRKQRDEELRRTWVTRFFAYWMKTLIGLDDWGSPIEQVARGNPEFSQAFGRPPRPRCSTDECVKYYESSYAVPVPGGTRIERSMRLWLRLGLQKGKLERAELLLPASGFSRWQEVEERRPSVDGDAEARAKAMDWALARVTPLLEPQPGQSSSRSRTTPWANCQSSSSPRPASRRIPPPENPAPGEPDPGQRAGAAASGRRAGEAAAERAGARSRDGDAANGSIGPRSVRAGTERRACSPAAGGRWRGARPRAARRAPTPGAAPQPAPAGAAQPQPAPSAAPSAPPAVVPTPAQAQPPMVRAYRLGALRIVVFAAPPSDPSGLDGVIIERSPARAR